jgi:SAM-dependent methyltransferase
VSLSGGSNLSQMHKRFRIKTLPTGAAMLNVACGTITHRQWNNIDFSPYAALAKRPKIARFLYRAGLLSEVRWNRLMRLDPDIVQWDLRKGLPYAAASFDVVYHSHFLEHLSRSHGIELLKECWRVLKPNGLLRIAVPDLNCLIADYCATEDDPIRHEKAIEALLDQMVRKEAVGPAQQKGLMRFVERIVRGNPDQTGERHLWMYDQVSLSATLTVLGFVDCSVHTAITSSVPGWHEFQLDADENALPYKPESLYLEALRPGIEPGDIGNLSRTFGIDANRGDRNGTGSHNAPSLVVGTRGTIDAKQR